MNIFYLNENPVQAAQWHCDGHVNKMIVESCQMMSTAVRMSQPGKPEQFWKKSKKSGKYGKVFLVPVAGDQIVREDQYDSDLPMPMLIDWNLMLPTHANHPSNRWVRESIQHYTWLSYLVNELHCVWVNVFGRNPHQAYLRFYAALAHVKFNLPDNGFVPPPRAMPIHFYRPSIVDSYQAYYKAKLKDWKTSPKKQYLAGYTNRSVPAFLQSELQ